MKQRMRDLRVEALCGSADLEAVSKRAWSGSEQSLSDGCWEIEVEWVLGATAEGGGRLLVLFRQSDVPELVPARLGARLFPLALVGFLQRHIVWEDGPRDLYQGLFGPTEEAGEGWEAAGRRLAQRMLWQRSGAVEGVLKAYPPSKPSPFSPFRCPGQGLLAQPPPHLRVTVSHRPPQVAETDGPKRRSLPMGLTEEKKSEPQDSFRLVDLRPPKLQELIVVAGEGDPKESRRAFVPPKRPRLNTCA